MPEHPPSTEARLPEPHPSQYVVVANAGAGSTETVAVGAAVARLAADAPTRLVWTEEPADFVAAVHELEEGHQVVVAGGDGSIHLALETVVELGLTDRPVGVIPLGTGNDFARNHGIPLGPVTAADVIVAGHVEEVDAMILDGEPESRRPEDERAPGTHMVANNIHVGLGVRAAERAAGMKGRLKRFAYPAATAYEGMRGDTVDLTVTVDGEQLWDGPLLAALVLLGPNMGGGVAIVPDDQAPIDVVLVEPATGNERTTLVAAGLRGRVFDAERAHRHRGRRVVIAGRDGVHTNADGEMVRYRTPVTLTHRPAAWKVILPASR